MLIDIVKPTKRLILIILLYFYHLNLIQTISIAETPCSAESFTCKSGNCINSTLVCDHVYDCSDGSDENDCDDQCPEGWYHCLNGNCILTRWRCDGDNDCGDHSDELNCGQISAPCTHNEFRCHDNSKCIPLGWVCDGNHDCRDQSDEVPGCVRQVPCAGFLCHKSQECIPSKWHCNGYVECDDGSDEFNCSGAGKVLCFDDLLEFSCSDRSECLAKTLVCNGIKNCPDGSDEGGQCDTNTCKVAACSHGCFQTPLKAACYCPQGYQLTSDNKTCKDTNECQIRGSCSQHCVNSLGSYTCSCSDGYRLDTDHHTCKLKDPEPILIYSASRELKLVKLHSGLAYSLHGLLSHAVGVDYDSQNDQVYWTEIADGDESIMSSNLDGSDVKSVVTTGINVVEDVAVDWIGRNIYFTDSGFQRLVVCGVDGVYCHVLLDGLKQPRALVIDPTDGFIFWTDWSHDPAIERMGMDGTGRLPLVVTDLGWPNGLTIDYPLRCLYWADGKNRRIESVNFDGSDRRVVLEEVMLHPFSLAVLEDTFFWTDWSRHTLESCHKFTGTDHKVLLRESGDNIPMGLHAYHPVLQPMLNNPCWGHSCSQLCLLTPTGGHRCACKAGHTMAADDRSCIGNVTTRVFLSADDTIYEFQEAIIGRNEIVPLDTKAKLLIGAMAYDNKRNTLLYSDMGTKEIVTVDLKTNKQTVLLSGHMDTVQGLAVDWIAQNLYWSDSARGTLEVCRADGNHRKILAGKAMGHPMGIALLPSKGMMYVAVIGSHPRIDRLDMDGTDRQVFIDYEMKSPTSLALDHSESRLYWVDAGAGKVEWASLDGKQRYAMKNYGGHPVSVSVSTDRLWWTDTAHTFLFWKDKDSSSAATSFPIKFDAGKTTTTIGLLTTDQILQDGSTGCAVANGECSHLCLPNKVGFVCDCPTGMELSKDHKTCQSEAKCNSQEFACGDGQCIPLDFTCDSVKDCNDGSDEVNCMRPCTEQEFRCDDGFCIPISWKCDHRKDCADHSDEISCNVSTTCPTNMFTCSNGDCIYLSWQCDGEVDCSDKSDENGCVVTCTGSEFQCKSGQCLPGSWRCDGEVDCRDGSDEEETCQTKLKVCKEKEFTCKNGRCVESDLVCDGDDDCGDGSDEAQCDKPASCPNTMFQCGSLKKCIETTSVCDEVRDCPSGEDELNCKQKSCDDREFQCPHSKICISESWLCDGENDCDDNSDETLPQCHHVVQEVTEVPLFVDIEEKMTDLVDYHQATYTHDKTDVASTEDQQKMKIPNVLECLHDQYQCSSGECIAFTDLCNHRSDCRDGSDEGSFCGTTCDIDNDGCSDICLPTPSGPVCWCRAGFQLQNDRKNCEDIDECSFLGTCSHTCHNVPGTFVCSCNSGYQLRSDHRSCKAEGPVPYLLLAFPTKLLSYTIGGNHVKVIVQNDKLNIKDVSFDTRTGDIFWVDSNAGVVSKYSSETDSHMDIIGDLESPSVLAIDWINRLLVFWDVRGYMVICTLSKYECSRVFNTEHRNLASMVLDPRKGTIYWSTWSADAQDDEGAIESVCMNGRKLNLLVSGKLIWPSGLTIDFDRDVLYWVDVHLQVIESADLNGLNRRVVSRKDITYPMSMALFEDRLYWADWGKNAILDCDRWTCRDRALLLEHVTKVHKLAIMHPVQQPNGTSPCQGSTKCSHICVPVPRGFACLCPRGMRFSNKQNTTCEAVPVKTSRHGVMCTSKTCFNGGTCTMNRGKTSCICLSLYDGPRCQHRAVHGSFDSSEEDDDDGSGGWVAGVIIGVLFVLCLALAVIWYCHRYDIDKFRGAFAPVPFNNPAFDADGEPQDEDQDNTNTSNTYRSYSNPLFETFHRDMGFNNKEGSVEFHVSSSSVSLDSAFSGETTAQTASRIDLTQKQKLIP